VSRDARTHAGPAADLMYSLGRSRWLNFRSIKHRQPSSCKAAMTKRTLHVTVHTVALYKSLRSWCPVTDEGMWHVLAVVTTQHKNMTQVDFFSPYHVVHTPMKPECNFCIRNALLHLDESYKRSPNDEH